MPFPGCAYISGTLSKILNLLLREPRGSTFLQSGGLRQRHVTGLLEVCAEHLELPPLVEGRGPGVVLRPDTRSTTSQGQESEKQAERMGVLASNGWIAEEFGRVRVATREWDKALAGNMVAAFAVSA